MFIKYMFNIKDIKYMFNIKDIKYMFNIYIKYKYIY